ncbi:MAG: M23 family metallopeptidase [Pseudobdellovibrio sp.]|nr:M23 family metallopeptidase [Pseudobdellovibrio sp.]
MSEPRKQITLYFVTSNESETKKISLPVAYFKISLFFLGFFAVLLMAGFIDYFGLLAQSLENKKLKLENIELKNQFQVVEAKLDSLQSAMDRVTNVSNKLKLITDIQLKDRPEKLNFPASQVGPKVDDPVPRMSLDDMEKDDPVIDTETPLNPMKGEVASEKSTANYASLVIRIDQAVKDSNLKEQSVIELWELLSDRQSLLAATPSIQPARGPIGSRFGYRIDPINGRQKMHAGLDITAPPGTPVRSPADGIVSFAGWDDQFGKLVSIDHGYGVLTRFAHNSQIFVQVGQKVSRYDVIAAVGSTGRSTGPHCHYEVRVNGIAVNPANYILDND